MFNEAFEFEAQKPSVAVVVVTPDMAERWLSRNVRNRPSKALSIKKYAADMAAGEWYLTGEGIKFGSDGTLLDGQNRLMACVKANAPFITYVFRGVPDVAQMVMDTGSARTASDSLAITGEKYTAILAAAAKLALGFAADEATPDHYPATHSQIRDFIEANPEMRDAAEFASKVARRTDCPPALVAYTLWTLGKIDRQAAYDFWNAAAEKVGLAAGDPVIALTNRFAESRRNRERMHKRAAVSAIYRAWNYRRAGRDLRQIKLTSSAGGFVPIPEPK